MGGICGFLGLSDKKLLQKMSKVVSHRGPDEDGFYLGDNVGLGSRRLAVIDPETGKQPIHNEDESVWLVSDGRIYNFPDLKEELEEKGHKFYTRTDVEVLVHLYEELGESFVEQLNGMFAFAIWDDNEKKLILARDKVGIKPLHYTQLSDSTFLFASEIKSILQHEEVKRIMDLQSLHYFLNLRYVPREKTMFKGIRRLLPAHLLIMSGGELKTRKYWAPEFNPTNKSVNFYIKKLRGLLKKSVERCLMGKIPVGVGISGGIDSSSSLALATQVQDESVETFCIGFGMPTDEIEDARFIAEHFGTNHHEAVKESDLLREFPQMIWYADEPKRNLYPYYAYKLAGEHAKVVLSGLGGDELFGGYPFKYNFISRVQKLRGKIQNMQREIIDAARKLSELQSKYGSIIDDVHLNYLDIMKSIDDNASLYLQIQSLDKVFSDEYLEEIYSEKMKLGELEPVRNAFEPYFNNDLEFIDQVLLADSSVKAVDDILLVEDRMSMAHSVETRYPFLNDELIEFSLTIPIQLKLRDPAGKYLLKKAVKPWLPKRVLEKEKQGFSMSSYEVFLRELREYAEQMLPEGDLVKEKYIKRSYIDKVLNKAPNPELSLHYRFLWNLLAAEIWHRIYISGDAEKPHPDINKMY